MKIKEIFEKEFLKIKENKKINTKRIIFIIGIIGILLIMLSSILPTENEASVKSEEDLDDYAEYLEKKVEETVNNIVGVGKSQVLITLDCSKEYIYATREKTSADTSQSSKSGEFSNGNKQSGEEEYIIIDTDNGEEALVVTEIAPKVKGVVVVCQGGGNQTVARAVKNAVTTALNISESKVCVTAMK